MRSFLMQRAQLSAPLAGLWRRRQLISQMARPEVSAGYHSSILERLELIDQFGGIRPERLPGYRIRSLHAALSPWATHRPQGYPQAALFGYCLALVACNLYVLFWRPSAWRKRWSFAVARLERVGSLRALSADGSA